jgi:hypothetical protein
MVQNKSRAASQALEVGPAPGADKLGETAGDARANSGNLRQGLDAARIEELAQICAKCLDRVGGVTVRSDPVGIVALMCKQVGCFAQPRSRGFVEPRALCSAGRF